MFNKGGVLNIGLTGILILKPTNRFSEYCR